MCPLLYLHIPYKELYFKNSFSYLRTSKVKELPAEMQGSLDGIIENCDIQTPLLSSR